MRRRTRRRRGGGGGGRGGARRAAPPAQSTAPISFFTICATASDELIGSVSRRGVQSNRERCSRTPCRRRTATATVCTSSRSAQLAAPRARQRARRLRAPHVGRLGHRRRRAARHGSARLHREGERICSRSPDVDGARADVVRARSEERSPARRQHGDQRKATLNWSPDRSKVFVGLKEQEAQRSRAATRRSSVEPVGNVDVWHWKDRVHPARADGARAAGSQSHVRRDGAARAEESRAARRHAHGSRADHEGWRWAIGQDDKDYVDDWKPQLERHLSREHGTGERTPVLKGTGAHARPVARREVLPLLEGQAHLGVRHRGEQAREHHEANAPVSFVNAEEDHVGEKPAYGVTRLHEGWQVGDPRPSVRPVGRVARRQRRAAAI